MTSAARTAVTLGDAALAHRERWVAARCGDRTVLRLDGEPDPVAAVRRAAAGEGAGAIVWLDGVGAAGPDASLLDELVVAARRGWAIALSVPGAGVELPAAPVPAAEQPAAVAEALAAAFDDAEIIPQRLAEASIIAGGDALVGTLDDIDPGPDEIHAHLVLAGLSGEAAQPLAVSVGMLHRTYLAWLEQANDELRRANLRLARERLGTYDTAAASLVNRVALAEQAQRRAEDAQRRAEEERDATLERLELEKEVAARNHGYFEAARDKLAEPQHRIAEGFVRRARHLPGARRLGAAVARRTLPRG